MTDVLCIHDHRWESTCAYECSHCAQNHTCLVSPYIFKGVYTSPKWAMTVMPPKDNLTCLANAEHQCLLSVADKLLFIKCFQKKQHPASTNLASLFSHRRPSSPPSLAYASTRCQPPPYSRGGSSCYSGFISQLFLQAGPDSWPRHISLCPSRSRLAR